MTRLLLVFLCAAVGTVIGYFILRSYRREFEYHDGVCALIGELKRNIAYRRDPATSVLDAFKAESALLQKNIEEYVRFARGKEGAPEISRGFLDADGYRAVSGFFGGLGHSEEGTQTKELDSYLKTFETMRDQAQKKCKVQGAVAVKLGFLLGLGVGILII